MSRAAKYCPGFAEETLEWIREMHELSIAQALVEQVEGSLAGNGTAVIVSVKVSIGEFSGVSSEALETVFPFAVEGTRMAGTTLVIERVPAVGRCAGCGHESSQEFPFAVCGKCGATNVELIRGREMNLVSIDIEETAPIIPGPEASG